MRSPTTTTPEDLLSLNYLQEKKTYITPLIFHNLRLAKDVLERVGYGSDIWEVRADLLNPSGPVLSSENIPSLDYVTSQLNYLSNASQLPIIFTIRTASQGGKFPDNARDEFIQLMLLALNHGCAYIDVQATWPRSLLLELHKRKNHTKLITSINDISGDVRLSDSALNELYSRMDEDGDILRLSLSTASRTDAFGLAHFVHSHKYKLKNPKPIIATAIGSPEQLSSIFYPVSLVYHPLLPKPSIEAPPSMADVYRCMHIIGELPGRDFFIFGHNISHSLSPVIHNTAFKELGLPHHYSIHQTPFVDDSVRRVLQGPKFGGASVTFPHKLSIQPLLDSMTDAAESMGAVNTVIVEEGPNGRKLRGDNTDWLGILKCIRRKLFTPHTAVVIGAGGAARAAVYAMQHLCIPEVVIINRTKATAERLVAQFPGLKIRTYETLAEAPAADLIVGCIPADDVTEKDVPNSLFSDEGMMIEMSYRPPVSALMSVARQNKNWTVFGGVDVLKEQAYAQFELWTGRRAPVSVIELALIDHNNSRIRE